MPPSGRRSPLLSFSSAELQPLESSIVFDPKPLSDNPNNVRKRWYHYLPLCGTLILLLAPHPSLFYFLFDFWYRTKHQPIIFATHLVIAYTLTFCVFSSLIVCLARDPGPPNAVSRLDGAMGEGEEMDLNQALMQDDDFSSPGKWCRKCWAPKPERAHHCSLCGRCVLKMDHHCPWIGNRCIGHRTYPAFVYFLCSITLLSLYIAVVSVNALIYSFHHPFEVNEMTPVHELFLAFMGAIFTLIIGSFACYHLYLITTNQTTLENITPFILLRHLPPLPRTGHSLSDPPLEPELSYAQRRLVKDAHSSVSLYNVGWRKNWAQVFGAKGKTPWLIRVFCGGIPPGDGKTFPRNPRSEEMLSRLASELVKADRHNT